MIFGSILESQNPLNFEKTGTFGESWKTLCFGNAFGIDFGAISRRPWAKFDGFWLEKRSKFEDLWWNFDAKPNWAFANVELHDLLRNLC